MSRIRTVLATFLVLVAAGAVAAQSTGSMKVIVVDKNDQTPLPGAVVVLTNTQQLIAETVQRTDRNGICNFPILRAGGGYIVEVQMAGYAPVRQPDIRVKIGQTATIPIGLGETIVEKVEVVADSDVVDLEETRTATRFDDEFIQDLPIRGRFYTEVLTLAPGVQDTDGDGNPTVHGSRERDFKTSVGGISNQDPLTGLALANVNYDSIEEIEVVTAGAGVEYGRAQGGFANIIEKQGTNQFEGLFSFTFSSSILDGNGATNLSGDRIPDFQWLQPAVQVSGPLIRDKLWYRFSHEYVDREIPINTLGDVNVNKFKRTTNSDQITWQVSRRNKLTFSLLSDPQETANAGVSSRTPVASTATVKFDGPTYRMEWSAPYSTRLLVTSRVAWQDATLDIFPTVRGQKNNCVSGLEALENANCFNVVDGLVSGSFGTDWSDNRQRLTVSSQAEIFGGRFWGIGHRFKLGLDIQNERYARSLTRRPSVSFFVLQDAEGSDEGGAGGSGEVERIGIISGQFSVPQSSFGRATGINWGLYASDVMTPLSNLTITAGVRVDREIINSDGFAAFDPEAEAGAVFDVLNPLIEAGVSQTSAIYGNAFNNAANDNFTIYEQLFDFMILLGQQLGLTSTDQVLTRIVPAALASGNWDNIRRPQNVNITNTNFSPFLGVTWDPFKDGKTKVAATSGRYYDKIFLAVPLIELEPATTNLNFRATNVAGQWTVNDVCQGSGACINPAVNLSVVDRNLRTPFQDELTFSFERELKAETALKLTYIRRKFKDQLQDIDLNRVPGDFGFCAVDSRGSSLLRASPGEGFQITDPFTGETYTDTDPGLGDGRLDDCTGRVFFRPPEEGGGGSGGPGNAPPVPDFQGIDRPDGLLDSYVQNPAWGQVLLVGNSNTAEYEGFVLELVRRQYRNWQMNGSYTWSKAIGDAEDFNQILGDDRTILDDERGFLSTDQRHVVKVNATTQVPWAGGFRFGTAVTWQSGLPYSLFGRQIRRDSVPSPYPGFGLPERRVRLTYLGGQRNSERNESWWNFDVNMVKEMNLRGGINLQLRAEIFNLLNDDHLRVLNNVNGIQAGFREFGRRFQVGFRVGF